MTLPPTQRISAAGPSKKKGGKLFRLLLAEHQAREREIKISKCPKPAFEKLADAYQETAQLHTAVEEVLKGMKRPRTRP